VLKTAGGEHLPYELKNWIWRDDLRRWPWSKLSLAAKCRILFGLAVLVIIAAAQLFPWILGNYLIEDVAKRQAEQVALAARMLVDLKHADWSRAQLTLNERWAYDTRGTELPLRPPRLIDLEGAKARTGFVRDSLTLFQETPSRIYRWKIEDADSDEPKMRLLMAVRDQGVGTKPGDILGLIEVQLAMDQSKITLYQAVMILAAAAAGSLAIVVFYVITQKWILSPVRDLKSVAEKVTTGDLAIRSGIATGDEFEDLSDAFNDMLIHLEASQGELQMINRSLDVKLGELGERNVALYESNKLKSEFLANVTHELRTPLFAIIGFAELLTETAAKEKADKDRMTRFSDNILKSGKMLLEIINDLLDLAKIEAGKMELHVSEFCVADVCRGMADFVRPLADKKNLSLTLQVDEAMPPVRSDSGKVKQVMYNLISNAIKFTPPGGEIGLSASRSNGSFFELTVSDTGPGIPAENQEMIFEKFRQIDSSVTREYEGTGLGLAITRELTHMLGGRISVESEEGKGSTFRVSLPFEAPDHVPDSAPIPLN
jgi:signal transduction histidine kinase